ncbi:methyl-accepting chemotaxis protein [Clostridium sp. BSD9I1]|uniref:methyl-accepting chemotaxis protein n=1 Tax=Clostridium sp. BSD9I1 TaxID=2003589 RepID=UPI0016484A1C|nr:methyl-accepting chemotaxis protein [Clostridium sp. BSD9I1]
MKRILKKFSSLKIKTVILFMSVFSILCLVLISEVGYNGMNKINNHLGEVYDSKLLPISYVGDIRGDVLKIRLSISKMSQENSIVNTSEIDEYDQKIKGRFQAYKDSNMKDDEEKMLLSVEDQYNIFINAWQKKKDRVKNGQKLTTSELSELHDLGEEVDMSIEALKYMNMYSAEDLNIKGDDLYYGRKKSLILIISICIFVFAAISYMIIKFINASMKNHINSLNTVAEGDFRVSLDTESKSEFGLMNRALAKTIDNISSMITEVKEKSNFIDKKSNDLSTIADEMSASSENVANSIQDAAEGTSSQAEEISTIVNILDDFSVELENIIQAIRGIDGKSHHISAMANESDVNMLALVKSINNIKDSFAGFASKVINLGENISQINEITDVINNIADQTNLLALNAAIEAARAGESGRGFSVVADEIRKLAEQSKVSSKNINSLINGISSETNVMVKNTGNMEEELTSQVNMINVTINSFKNILKAVEEVIPEIEAVNSTALNINEEKDIILEKIQQVSAIAEEVSASSEEIAAAAQESNLSSHQVAKTSEELSSMTKEMINDVEKFKLANSEKENESSNQLVVNDEYELINSDENTSMQELAAIDEESYMK